MSRPKLSSDAEASFDVKSVLHRSFDADALLGYTAISLSVLRRTNIRPALSEEYRGLCKLKLPGYAVCLSLWARFGKKHGPSKRNAQHK